MVDKIIDIFATDRNPTDARHSFEHLKQSIASNEAIWDYVIRATTLAEQARKPLFSDEVVPPRDAGDYADNLTRVVNGIYNADVRDQMIAYLPTFMPFCLYIRLWTTLFPCLPCLNFNFGLCISVFLQQHCGLTMSLNFKL